MKTYSFDIFKCRVTITIEKRKYETIDRLETAKELVKSQPNEIKMEDFRSVEECFTEYIESQRGILSDATIKGYENVRDKHLDFLMICYMSKIDENDIQKAFDAEIAKGFSKKTLKGYKSLILKVLAVYRPDLKPEIRIEKEISE